MKQKSLAKTPRAFSLVEVTLALGIAGFCLVAVFGLLPVGLNANQASLLQSAAANVAKAVAADLRATPPVTTATAVPVSPRYKFSPPTTTNLATAGSAPQTVFTRDDGSITTSVSDAKYKVCVGFVSPTGGIGATSVRLLVVWPAAASPQAGSWPIKYSGSFETAFALTGN